MGQSSIKSYQGQLSLPFELGENIHKGTAIYVYDDAGTPKIAKCQSKFNNKSDYAKGYYNCGCMISSDLFVVVFRDLNHSNHGRIRAGRIEADNSITWGPAQTFWATTAYYMDVCSHANNNFCITYKGSSDRAELQAGSVDGVLNITFGTPVTYVSVGTCYYNQIISPAADKICVVFRDAGHSNYLDVCAATITGTVIGTLGLTVTLDTAAASYVSLCSPDTDKIVATYYGSSKGYAVAATLSGTGISAGTRSEFSASPVYSTYVKPPDTNKIVVIYRNSADGYKPYARCATLSGTNFTWGSAIKVHDASSYYQAIGVLDTDSVVFLVTVDTVPYKGVTIKATFSGTTISLEPEDIFNANRSYYVDCLGIDTDKYCLLWYDTALLNSYALVVEGLSNTIPQCIGILEEEGLTGETKRCAMLGGISKSLSGMDIGAIHYINEDGYIMNIISPYPIGMAYETNRLLIDKHITE